jgi:hypothetical protein
MDITKRHAAMLSQGLWSLILERIVDRDLWDVEDVKLDNGGGYLTHLSYYNCSHVSPQRPAPVSCSKPSPKDGFGLR